MVVCFYHVTWPFYSESIHSHMHHTDKYSQHSSIIWPVWLNGLVFIYELSSCGFESRCSHYSAIYLPKSREGVCRRIVGNTVFPDKLLKYL